MKKLLYIVAFSFFGLIVSTIVHAVIELVALQVIFGNPETFANTFWWNEWDLLHGIVSGILWFLGCAFGVYLGFIFWEPYGSKTGLYHWKK